MTKQRAPISFEDGITRVAAMIGWEAAASAIEQKERTLRNYSDPDTPEQIKLPDSLLLDMAFRRAGGEGAPLFEAYALQLDIATRTVSACGEELARRTAVAAKEGGEAIAALITATRLGAKPAEIALALREVREGVDAFSATLPMLEQAAAPPAAGDPSIGGAMSMTG